jgi:hypothetical protein
MNKIFSDDYLIQQAYALVRNQEMVERVEMQDLPEVIQPNTRMLLRMVDVLIQLQKERGQ